MKDNVWYLGGLGQSRDDLPIGLQLMGKHFDEATLLNVAHQFQKTTEHHLKHPSL